MNVRPPPFPAPPIPSPGPFPGFPAPTPAAPDSPSSKSSSPSPSPSALLSVALVFYQQIARLRDQTLADTAGLAAARLGMDRLAAELRTALPRPGTFRGGPQDLEFVRYLPVDLAAGSASGSGTNANATTRSPLRRLRYRLAGSDTNNPAPAAGLERTEESAATFPSPTLPDPEPTPAPASPAAPTDPPLDSTSEITLASIDPTDPLDTEPVETPSATPGTRLLIAELRYFALRYWDGVAWVDSWAGPGLPRGVEISLATDAPSATAPPDTLPFELFRRVVALPTAEVLEAPLAGADAPSSTRRGTGRTLGSGGSTSPEDFGL